MEIGGGVGKFYGRIVWENFGSSFVRVHPWVRDFCQGEFWWGIGFEDGNVIEFVIICEGIQ